MPAANDDTAGTKKSATVWRLVRLDSSGFLRPCALDGSKARTVLSMIAYGVNRWRFRGTMGLGGTPMATIAFDTLKFSKRLKDAGVPEKQAEVEAEALAEILEVRLKDLATKDELKAMEERLGNKLTAMDNKITVVEERLGDKIALLEHRMTIKLGGLIVVAIGAVATLVKLL
jgi:hypothetical protein